MPQTSIIRHGFRRGLCALAFMLAASFLTVSCFLPAKAYADTLRQTVEGWGFAGVTCSEPVEVGLTNIGHVTSYTTSYGGKVIDGADIQYDTVQTITIDADCLLSRGNQIRPILQKVLNTIDRFNDSNPKLMFRVILPAGTYYLTSSPLHIYSNTWIDMSAGTRIVRCYQSGSMLRSSTSTLYSEGYSAARNIYLQGGTWDGNIAAYPKGTSSNIRLGHCRDVVISGVTFDGCVSDHHLEFCGVACATVTSCTFKNGRGSTAEAIQIDFVNNSLNSPNFGAFDDTMSRDIVICDNVFKSLTRGVGTHSSIVGKYSTRILVKDNTFSKIRDQAILASSFRHYAFIGNTIDDCGVGITCLAISTSNCKPLTGGAHRYTNMYGEIRNNAINASTRGSLPHYGIRIAGATIGKRIYSIARMTIKGNTVSGYSGGIHMYRALNCSVGSNSIASSGGNGLLLERSAGIFLRDCTIANCGHDGIHATDHSKVCLNASIIRFCGRYGICSCRRSQVKHCCITLYSCSGNTCKVLDTSGIAAS